MEKKAAPHSPRESILLSPEEVEPVHNLTAAENGVEPRKHREEQGSAAHKAPQGAR